MRRSVRSSAARAFTPFVVFALALVGLPLPVARAAPAPVVTGFSPACAAAGASVAIGGQHFQGATSVEFNGVDATAFTVSSSNLISATVPSTGSPTGKITVTTPDGSDDSTDDFVRADDCRPTVTGFSPGSGPVGQTVTIDGTKLVGATLVEFGGVDQTSVGWSPDGTQITTTVPSGAVDGPISVTTSAGTATSVASFDVTPTPPAPTITSFVPISGPVGTSVVITGTNLSGATEVKFKNTSATSFAVNSATQITAVVPSGAMTGKISVTTPGGTASSATNFTVTAAGSPTIVSFSPTSGSVGTGVTITGTNLTGTTSVAFNGTSASFTVNSSTQITATVPPLATTGPITATNPNGTGTSATDFTVLLTRHPRAISLDLRRHLVARGFVTTSEDFSACYTGVPVKIQHRVSGTWRTIDSTITDGDGFYRARTADLSVRYRAKASKVTIGSDVCVRAISPVATN
ncbi:MAG: hypothetical protein A2Z48_10745 [Actinobacteria bacterium RBG_19FT_COMBO_70_19]|nr:MAG: hypothetical protein A2Z48_10745 [Actinobacteria bacterium RBG_19FT_COMBO_70_19]